MIRTKLVELSTLNAFAYRQKLRGGQTSIKIMRLDQEQPGLATLNRNTGAPDLSHNTDIALFPLSAFEEATELTAGLPYTSRGAVKISLSTEAETPEEQAAEEQVTVDSAEYAAIIGTYTNRRGELSYELINRDLIQLAKSNGQVGQKVADHASVEDIRQHIVRTRFRAITNNRDLSDAQLQLIVEMLDDVSPRGVFRELNDEIRKLLARG